MWSRAFICCAWFLEASLAGAQADGLKFDTDLATGYALSGHDPVAYFIDHAPRFGKDTQAFSWEGTTWVFVNEGNRQAFEADPRTYAPQFSGCDPYALASGFATIGNAKIFLVHNTRLYLFHSSTNRFLFMANPEHMLKDAAAHAPAVGCSTGKR